MPTDRHAKFLGAMIGGALGDAIGELAARTPEREALLHEIETAEKLCYSGDTVMTLAVAETLVTRGDIAAQDLGDRLRDRYHKEPWRGYSDGLRKVFEQVEREGIDYLSAARGLYGGEGSYGNGAAMRIVPVGLYFYRSDQFYDKVQAAAEVTHAHALAIDAAAALAKAQAEAVSLNYQRPFSPQGTVAHLTDFARTPVMKERLARIPDLIADGTPAEQAAARFGTGLTAHESVPYSLYCFLRHPHTFMECVLCAVLHGGDRDTLGAMAGAVAGAYLGIEAIPPAWRRRLENGQYIETLARELEARCQG